MPIYAKFIHCVGKIESNTLKECKESFIQWLQLAKKEITTNSPSSQIISHTKTSEPTPQIGLPETQSAPLETYAPVTLKRQNLSLQAQISLFLMDVISKPIPLALIVTLALSFFLYLFGFTNLFMLSIVITLYGLVYLLVKLEKRVEELELQLQKRK